VYLYVDGENFNERLLAEGYARMYDSQFSLREEFATAEQEAQATDVGLWDFQDSATESGTDSDMEIPHRCRMATTTVATLRHKNRRNMY